MEDADELNDYCPPLSPLRRSAVWLSGCLAGLRASTFSVLRSPFSVLRSTNLQLFFALPAQATANPGASERANWFRQLNHVILSLRR